MILLSWKLASFVFVQRVEMRQQSDKFNITFIKISVCKAISIVRMKTKSFLHPIIPLLAFTLTKIPVFPSIKTITAFLVCYVSLPCIFWLQNDKSLAVLPDSTHTCLSSGIVDLTRPVTGPRQSGHLLSLFSLHSDGSQGKLASEILKTNLIV